MKSIIINYIIDVLHKPKNFYFHSLICERHYTFAADVFNYIYIHIYIYVLEIQT